MAGIRIHHPQLSSCILLVSHPGDPRTGRRAKDYPIHLDSEGDSIVSETVWRRLREADAAGQRHGFIVLNEVPDPPTLMIHQAGPVERRRELRLDGDRVVDPDLVRAAQVFAPAGIRPRIHMKET